MASEEYVEQLDRLINLQNTYLSIFLAVLAIILAFVGVLQWRLSTKQIEKIKDSVDKELDAKYNLQAIKNIENTTLLINKTVSHSIITLGKQVFSISGPNLRSIMEFRGLIDPLYNFDVIESNLAEFLINTIEMIIERFQHSQETTLSLNSSMKKMKGIQQDLESFTDSGSDDIYVDDDYFHKVKVMLLDILDLVKSKSNIKEDFDFEKIEEDIRNFKRK